MLFKASLTSPTPIMQILDQRVPLLTASRYHARQCSLSFYKIDD
jgi:hypothetical protein